MEVILAAGEAPWEAAAVREIEGSSRLSLVRRCVDVADMMAVASTVEAGIALVSVALPGLDADAVHRMQARGLRVAAVGSDTTKAKAMGIEIHAAIGSLDDVARDYARPIPSSSDARRAPLVAVWGPAGAPGRSTLALSLAAASAARGTETVVVDADTYGGSLGQMVAALDDVSGLMAACRAANQGRASDSAEHLLVVDERLSLMTGIQRADMWSHIRSGALSLVLAQLRRECDLVVVDCGFGVEAGLRAGPARDDATRLVLEEADEIIVVGRADPVGLARLVRAMHEVREVAPAIEPQLIINMVRSSLGWNEREVVATISRLTGVRPAACLPYDRSGLDLALLTGRTPRVAAPASPYVSRVEVLAAALVARWCPASATSATSA